MTTNEQAGEIIRLARNLHTAFELFINCEEEEHEQRHFDASIASDLFRAAIEKYDAMLAESRKGER